MRTVPSFLFDLVLFDCVAAFYGGLRLQDANNKPAPPAVRRGTFSRTIAVKGTDHSSLLWSVDEASVRCNIVDGASLAVVDAILFMARATAPPRPHPAT